jgi:hypothetical protein
MIELINDYFGITNLIKCVGSSAGYLYIYLIYRCNKSYWLNPFELRSSDISHALGEKEYNREAIRLARNVLKQRGLIDFVACKGRPTIYTLLGADLKSVEDVLKEFRKKKKSARQVVSTHDNSLTTFLQLADNSLTTSLQLPDNSPIIINNKTKRHKDVVVDTHVRTREDCNLQKSEDVKNSLTLQEVAAELAADPIWIESVSMQFKNPNIPERLAAFITSCQCEGRTEHRDIQDAKKHFCSWMRIQESQKSKPPAHDPKNNQRLSADDARQQRARELAEYVARNLATPPSSDPAY